MLAERLKSGIHIIYDKPDRKHTLEISFGEARSDPENPCTLDELFAQADQMMYESKRLRKDPP
nr:diguanylate cyclase [Desulfobulbaceae bacterium]